uniref:DUF4065 domain-containing protein n=1 Tax=Panagrellus redivivus TaxID=6233 RepID=A0A7E4V3L2_PANRE
MINHNSTKPFVTSYMSNYPTWYAPGFDPNDQTNYQGLNSFYPEYLKDIELDEIDQKVHALLWSDKPIIETLRKLK